MTREDVVKQVVLRVSALGVASEPLGTITRTVLNEKYPQRGSTAEGVEPVDYRFGPADVLEVEREMRRRLRV